MTIMTTYYEKLVGDLLNKVFIDVKKFIIQDKFINEYNKRVDEFEKIMELYLIVINDLKRMKSNELETDSYNEGNVSGPSQTEFNNMKNEMSLLKGYLETLKADNSKLINEKKTIEETFEFYNNTNTMIYKKEFEQVKSSIEIMKVYLIY